MYGRLVIEALMCGDESRLHWLRFNRDAEAPGLYLSNERAGAMPLGNPLVATFPAGDVVPALPFPFTLEQFCALEQAQGPFGLVSQLKDSEIDLLRYSMAPAHQLVSAVQTLPVEPKRRGVLQLPHDGRYSVAEAKRLIVLAFPPEPAVDIFVRLDEQGHPLECEHVVRFNGKANLCAPHIDGDFGPLCAQLGILPRMRFRPAITDYKGGGSDDDVYSVTADELTKLAGAYGLDVSAEPVASAETSRPALAIGQAEEPKLLPVSDPTHGLRTDEVCDAFAGLRWDRQGWQRIIDKDRPTWLRDCLVAAGRQGHDGAQALWHPIRIGHALVSGSVKKVKGAPPPPTVKQVTTAFRMQPLLARWRQEWEQLRTDRLYEG